MKNILRVAVLAICAIFMVANVSAQVITAERASEIANQFFANGKQKGAAFRSTNATLTQSIDSRAVTGKSNDAPTFHILTGADGKGFVIVSGEETENPIIGYSFDGTIDTNNLPDGFVDYMTDIDAQVRALREYNAANPQKAAARSTMQRTNYNATSMGKIQVLLETAKWGQGSPFNRLCFTDATHTTNAATGCVPTAFAIVMRYHKWPEEGIGRLVDFQLSTSDYIYITDRTYDWDNMPLVYDGNWSDYQINEVAKVMRDLGQAYMVEYGTSETGVSVPGNSGKLETYFNYNYVSGISQAQAGSIDSWKSRIKESLDNNCPIPYKSHNSASGDSNHMFVLDGYTDNDYFHFNWGWSGSGNGWFKLDDMQPLGSNYSWGASSDHMAIFNLTPKKTLRTVTASVSPAGAGSVTVNGSANSAEVTEGTTATLVATANSGYTFSHWSKGGTEVGTEMTYKAKVAAEGNEYVANFYTIGSSINIPVNYDSNMGSVTYNGNIVSATGFNPNEYSEVTLTAEANDGYMFTGWEITEGTETTKSSEKSITFIAKSGITVNANFALAGGEYKINSSNISPSGTGKCSTWTYSKEGDIEGILTLSTANGSTVVNALGTSNRLYAHAYDNSYNGFREITYTLTAKEGFVITGYSLTYAVSKAGQVTVRNATQTQTPNDFNDYTLTYQYANTARTSEYGTRTAEFVLSSTTASNQQYITIKDFTVTVLSEGAEGGSTPTPDPTPTTYTVTTTANPAEGGTAKFAVGTGSQQTQGDVNNGEQITLYAVANTGYTFVNWTLNGNVVGTDATCNVSVAQTANYVANFKAEQQPGEQLAGKYFRIKEKSTGNYMNIANTTNNISTTSGVTVVAKSASSKNQIFLFEQSGDGYKLKANSGNYIKCHAWNANADATSAANATVLTFESTGNELEYLIKWENKNMDGNVERDDYFKTQNVGGTTYVFCDAAKSNAVTWVLEEVVYYTIAVTAGNGGNASIGTETSTTIEHGGSVTLTAVANEGYHFVNWTLNGAVVSTNASYTFTATAAGEYVANFEKNTYTISVSANGTGGSAMIGTNTKATVEHGGSVTLTAVPSEGYHFVNWTKGTDVVSTDANYTVTNVTAAGEYVANFEKNTYTISVSANGTGGSAMIGTNTSATVEHGSSVTLTAVANEGYHFVNWTKGTDVVSNSAEYTINNVTAAGEYVANFEKNTYTISVSANGTGGSAMIGTNTSATVEHGSSVTLTAVANEGYHFVNWTKGTDVVSTNAEYTINNVTAAGEYVANFVKNTYTIRVSANGTGGSAMIGTNTSATVEHGGSVTLTAVANNGYEFVNWTKGTDFVSSDANYTVTNVTANAEYVANFQLANTPATHCNVTVNANISGTGIAFIHTGTSTDVTSGRYEVGSTITLTAVSDKDENGYLFTGWYVDGELISTEKTYTVTLSSDVTYTAMFEEGWRVRYSCKYIMGYIRVLDADGNDIGGTNYVLVKKGSTIQMLGVPQAGYEFKNWTTNATSDFVSSNNPYSFAVEKNMNLTANFEPEHYVLTVRANNDEYGTVTAESGTFGPASSVKVGIAMTATITAIAKDGYKFVNWTKDSEVVSTDAIYTVPSVDYSKDLIDTEYIANFEPIENATPGIYYRIGYDVTVPAAAGAARAATDETQTYVVSPNTGTLTGGSPSSEWVCTDQPALTITATNDDGAVKNIYSISNGTKLSFNAYKSPHYTTTYTISVTQNSGYRIIGYSMSYSVYSGARVQNEINNYDVTPGADKTGTMEAYGIDVQNVVFTVTRTGGQYAAIDISSFTVTLQQVDSGGEGTPETPETTTNRYYVQSKPVSGTNNAMVMEMETEENYASSIFYYAGDKLLSYDKGLYVKEYDNTRGLQAVGEEPGTVKITTVGKTSTIAAPSYMHANVNGTTYFVDHCGSDNGDPEHNFVLEKMTALPVTIGNALHATLYAPVALEIPVGVKAYVLKEKDITAGSYVTMSRLSSIIPANTGVILKSERADRFDFVITESTYEAEEEADGNVLEGTVAKSIVNEDAYILANRNGNIGLYPLNTNSYITGEATSTFTNNSHKAYLPVKGNFAQWLKQSNGFRFVFDDDIVTDLHEVETDEDIETIYDLQGRKLSEITQPGMYIINGKKVWVK